MLPKQNRLHRAADFTVVVRRGRRVGRRHLVLHVRRTDEADAPLARQGGPLVPIPQEAIDSLFDRYQNVYGQNPEGSLS